MYRYLIISIATVLVLTGSVVRAEDQTSLVLDDNQISQVKINCVAAQSSLARIHANDALTRVNIGQQYEVISTHLMAPMNSRIALNKLDGIELAKTAIDYKKQIDEFTSNYIQYEKTMSSILRIDCRKQPLSFYNTITLARDKREIVRNSVLKLEALTKQYSDQFTVFRASVLAAKDLKN